MGALLGSLHPTPAGVRFPHVWEHDGLVASSGRGSLSEYCALRGRATLLSLRDPARFPAPDASDGAAHVATWVGRRPVTPAAYAAAAVRFGADAAVTLHDETALGAGKNRVRSGVTRSVRWARECLAAWTASAGGGAAPPSALCFLPCVADTAQRCSARREVLACAASAPPGAVLGFVFGGLALGEAPRDRAELVREALRDLPPPALRVLPGLPGSPPEVLDALADGVDVLDSDYPALLTAAGCAAGWRVTPPAVAGPWHEGAWDADAPVALVTYGDEASGAPARKARTYGEARRRRGSSAGSSDAAAVSGAVEGVQTIAAAASAATATPTEGVRAAPPSKGFSWSDDDTSERSAPAVALDATRVRVHHARYAGDAAPLLAGCTCFACAGTASWSAEAVAALGATKDGRAVAHGGHTRGYVHHLLSAHELLGPMLLSVHNVHHYDAFFAAVRDAIALGRFDAYARWFRRVNGFASG